MSNIVEWIGYLASAIILVSLLMSSIIKLRIINTVGSVIFAVYGIIIGSIPVAVMNFGIVGINIYYLIKMYSAKDPLNIVEMAPNSEYMINFLDYYSDEIKKFSDFRMDSLSDTAISFLITRDMQDAGVFICSEHDEETLNIELDFVTPQYRDFQIGSHIFSKKNDVFLSKGYKRFVAESENPVHVKYLRKMGFKAFGASGRLWEKDI